jgi:hypothetical protein
VFLFSDAGMTSGGTPYCYAIAGVSPKGSDRFPTNRYTRFIQSQDKEVLRTAKKRAWAIDCARNAVENMMTEDLDTLYEPDTAPSPGRRPSPSPEDSSQGAAGCCGHRSRFRWCCVAGRSQFSARC